jgi:hypothetical protein
MHDDLETNLGYRYSIATLVFFITYTVFQPPATIVTRKLGPRNFLPTICVAWGIVMVCRLADRVGLTDISDWLRLRQRLGCADSIAFVAGLLRSRLFPRYE